MPITGILAPHARHVPDLLIAEEDAPAAYIDAEELSTWLRRLLRNRQHFGITRVGSLTRLDRIGLSVVQVTRPLALSNAVSQGKGMDILTAAASGLMESLETWAAERIPDTAVRMAAPSALGMDWMELYARWVDPTMQANWASREVPLIDSWDLMSSAPGAVPLALVDTVYTCPDPHPAVFPRVTTGLGAGRSLMAAIIQAGLEILERHALVGTRRTPYFYERFQIDLTTVREGDAVSLLRRVQDAGFVVAAWRAQEAHPLPVYRCHVMEGEWPLELAPMPAEGSACRFTSDGALVSALLEACQARAATIAGAREDLTRRMYPSSHERKHLAEWRDQLRSKGSVSHEPDRHAPEGDATGLPMLVEALKQAGARAILVVPLFTSLTLGVYVVRVVAPPLRLWPGGRHG
ncbi:YcaO-like family protein [Microvirga sp. VF16]|uniref:YcaO-like family protein n=1 Tax=Microvirga sp. VF16 TaxID=2807101 RepID=UPI00193E47FE|nr:YcaO-like family protein [Microvirga sp. VF16]QRM29962.1 YcaO-like family protein [Microvirga sp. VF16]